jgi:hypothetical protein
MRKVGIGVMGMELRTRGSRLKGSGFKVEKGWREGLQFSTEDREYP